MAFILYIGILVASPFIFSDLMETHFISRYIAYATTNTAMVDGPTFSVGKVISFSSEGFIERYPLGGNSDSLSTDENNSGSNASRRDSRVFDGEKTVQDNVDSGNANVSADISSAPTDSSTSAASPAGTLQIPYTGLTRYHASPDIAKFFGLNGTTYAMIITAVEPGSPAAMAGIRGGDINTNVNGEIIKTGGDTVLRIDGNDSQILTNDAFLRYLQNEKRVGENMTLTVLRDGRIQDIDLTIGALPRFLWYEDMDEGIKIKYPSDWQVSETGSIDDIVKFLSPEDRNVGNMTLPAAGIFVVIRPAGDIDLDDIATAEQIDTEDVRHLGITLTSVSNLPGYETVYLDYSNEKSVLKVLSTFTINDGHIYRINFASDPSSYNDYIALAKEVIKSFQFTG